MEEPPRYAIRCYMCRRPISEQPFYAPDSRGGDYIHKSCAELPPQIDHSFHRDHGPLTLVFCHEYRCTSCLLEFKDGLLYFCEECEIIFCVDCTLFAPAADYESELQHFSHPHPLLPIGIEDRRPMVCAMCKLPGSDLLHGCEKCEFFLHKHCAELPQKVEHHLHQDHGLLSLCLRTSARHCELCLLQTHVGSDRYNFTLECERCFFKLCWPCCQTIKRSFADRPHKGYGDHRELYYAGENETELLRCDGYDSYCKQLVTANSIELTSSNTHILKCPSCDFKIHLLCGPLPSIIKHDCHVHCLVLFDSIIEDDSGEYYCDACEEERDPRIRVYSCEECKYFAHVKCVLSAIVNPPTRELRDVELKILGQTFWESHGGVRNDGIETSFFHTLEDMISWLEKEEKDRLSLYYKWENDKNQSKVDGADRFDELDDKEVGKILRLSRFSSSEFEDFFKYGLEEFWAEDKLMALQSSDLKQTLVGACLVKTSTHNEEEEEEEEEEYRYAIPYMLHCIMTIILNWRFVSGSVVLPRNRSS